MFLLLHEMLLLLQVQHVVAGRVVGRARRRRRHQHHGVLGRVAGSGALGGSKIYFWPPNLHQFQVLTLHTVIRGRAVGA